MKISNRFQFSNVLTIAFAHLFHDIYSSFLAPLLPLLIEKYSISYALAGLLSVFQRLPSLLNPIFGLYADRVKIYYIVSFAPLVTAVSMSLLGIASHYAMLAILLSVMGISSAFFHVPAPVVMKRVSGNRTGKGMSFYMLGGEAARTVGPLIILGGVSLWTLEGTWRLIPFALIASIFFFVTLRNVDIKGKAHINEKPLLARQIFKKLIPFFIIISGITFFRAGMKAAFTIFLPTYLNTKGASLWIAGVSLSIVQFSGAIGTFFAGTISDIISRKTTLLIIAGVTPILMWLFVVLDSIFTLPILIVTGFFLFASGPVILAMVQDIDSDHPSFINGVFMTINFIGHSVAIMFIGLLVDWIGFEYTYKLAAFSALLTIPLVSMLKKEVAL